jgi:hypothetical protein
MSSARKMAGRQTKSVMGIENFVRGAHKRDVFSFSRFCPRGGPQLASVRFVKAGGGRGGRDYGLPAFLKGLLSKVYD